MMWMERKHIGRTTAKNSAAASLACVDPRGLPCSADPMSNLSLDFDSRESAMDYCERNGECASVRPALCGLLPSTALGPVFLVLLFF